MYVALYARHSTDKQARSTGDQIDRLRDYCRQRGYVIVDAFIDEARSGADMQNRRGIRRLMSRSVENCFVRIVTEDLSRLSRDLGDVAFVFKKMSFLGITIETVTEGVINELHIGLKGTMNALYLKDLGDKTHRGVVASVRKGGVPGGRTYGYDIVHQLDAKGEPIRGLRKINEAEAAVIRQIFAGYAIGKTLAGICADLNAQAIDPPKGDRWAPTTLVGTASRKTGLLRQTLYMGVITFNRMAYRKHPDTGKRLSVVRPEDEWVTTAVPELAIIDTELFDRVQAMLEERSSMRAQRIVTNKVLTAEEKAARNTERQRECRARQLRQGKVVKTIVSGRLHCAQHDEKVTAIYTSPSGLVLGCPHRGCGNRNIRMTTILPLALRAALAIDRTAMAAHFDSPEVRAARAGHEAAIAALGLQVETLRAEVNNAIAALGQQARTVEIRSYFDGKSMEIRRLKLDIEAHEREMARLALPSRTDEILRRFRRWIERLHIDAMDREATTVLRPLITRVTLSAIRDLRSDAWVRSARMDLDYGMLLKVPDL